MTPRMSKSRAPYNPRGAAVPRRPGTVEKSDMGDIWVRTGDGDAFVMHYSDYMPYDTEAAFNHVLDAVFPVSADSDSGEAFIDGTPIPTRGAMADSFIEFIDAETSVHLGTLQYAINQAVDNPKASPMVGQYPYGVVARFVGDVNEWYADWVCGNREASFHPKHC